MCGLRRRRRLRQRGLRGLRLRGLSRPGLLSLRNTSVGNILALSGITIPAGLDAAGMPVGLQCVGASGRAHEALAHAAWLEKVLAR